MRISILCSSVDHPVNQYLEGWVSRNGALFDIELVRRKEQLSGGDLLFLISCAELIDEAVRTSYRKSLVLHASDLPLGRGWSPHIWEILAGAQQLTLSLIEASEPVDSGHIWKKTRIPVPKDALWDEINDLLFKAEMELMDFAVQMAGSITPQEQDKDIAPSYYPKRRPEDSQIDAFQSIESQFDKIRVCDPVRFPAFFDLHGHRYRIKLEKMS